MSEMQQHNIHSLIDSPYLFQYIAPLNSNDVHPVDYLNLASCSKHTYNSMITGRYHTHTLTHSHTHTHTLTLTLTLTHTHTLTFTHTHTHSHHTHAHARAHILILLII